MTEPHTTSAGQWFDARLRGERLPEHEHPAEWADLNCPICDEPLTLERGTAGMCALCMCAVDVELKP